MIRNLILASTFLSAFLLFVIQPLYAKFLLPFFGGTSSVWTISVFFYSTTLLFGYIYAALLSEWRSKLAWSIHSALLVLTGSLLLSRWLAGDSPLLIDAIENSSPAFSVLLTLLMGVGLPVLLLASTSVITQNLYARLTGQDPYRLYALSNAGSFLGLASYPFLLEPTSSISIQSDGWAVLFIAFLVMLITAWHQLDSGIGKIHSKAAETLTFAFSHRASILIMAAVPTFLLVSLTEHLSKGIASFPLMWVMPLMLYLLSFIFAFNDKKQKEGEIPFRFWVMILIIFSFLLLPFGVMSASAYWLGFLVSMPTFYLICFYFHRRIYELRPRTSDLGTFYIWLTFGGALGSGIVGLLLPLLLNDQVELYIMLGALGLNFLRGSLNWLHEWVGQKMVKFLKVFFYVCLLLMVGKLAVDTSTLHSERNFFGVLKVYDRDKVIDGELVPVRMIVNGATNHGMQAQDERYYQESASYYGPDSGIDIAIRSFVDNGELPNVSVVGLGAGMMNAYCDEFENISYIEINPVVEGIARDYFTYLDICPDKTIIEVGDGRLLLEEKALEGSAEYDVIMMDAFTDDAIPSHLLTLEAFETAYIPLLSEQGLIAFHISNKYLNLYPPIVGAARKAGLEVVTVRTPAEEGNDLHLSTVWVLATYPEYIERLLGYNNVSTYGGEEIVWTDYKNSVLDVLSLSGSKNVK